MRTTLSRKPTSRPVKAAKEYLDMVATRIQFTMNDGETRMQVRFEATDDEEVIHGHQYRLDIANIESEEANVPKLVQALDNLHDVLGLYYTYKHLEQELIDTDEDDAPAVAEVTALRDAAKTKLRDPVVAVTR